MKSPALRTLSRSLFTATALLLSASCGRPQVLPPSLEPLPPALESYQGRPIATTMHWAGAEWLTREYREREEAASLMIEKLGIQPGQTVCDLGCGNGFHTLRLAECVGPAGRVLAVDIQPEMLAQVSARAEAAGISSISTIPGSAVDPHLPAGAVDLVLLVDVYHEFSHPVHMLAAIRECLAPHGRVVLVEFRAEDNAVPIKPEHKMNREQILKELSANGFQMADEFPGLPWQHMMFFEVRPAKD